MQMKQMGSEGVQKQVEWHQSGRQCEQPKNSSDFPVLCAVDCIFTMKEEPRAETASRYFWGQHGFTVPAKRQEFTVGRGAEQSRFLLSSLVNMPSHYVQVTSGSRRNPQTARTSEAARRAQTQSERWTRPTLRTSLRSSSLLVAHRLDGCVHGETQNRHEMTSVLYITIHKSHLQRTI